VRGNVIRFLPPLTIEEALLDEALEIIAESLAETVAVKTLA
jgi:4-aminobutyrate aminotransferase-like enzyme